MTPSNDEIQKQIVIALAMIRGESGYHWLSYEHGVIDTLKWIMGKAEKPLLENYEDK